MLYSTRLLGGSQVGYPGGHLQTCALLECTSQIPPPAQGSDTHGLKTAGRSERDL